MKKILSIIISLVLIMGTIYVVPASTVSVAAETVTSASFTDGVTWKLSDGTTMNGASWGSVVGANGTVTVSHAKLPYRSLFAKIEGFSVGTTYDLSLTIPQSGIENVTVAVDDSAYFKNQILYADTGKYKRATISGTVATIIFTAESDFIYISIKFDGNTTSATFSNFVLSKEQEEIISGYDSNPEIAGAQVANSSSWGVTQFAGGSVTHIDNSVKITKAQYQTVYTVLKGLETNTRYILTFDHNIGDKYRFANPAYIIPGVDEYSSSAEKNANAICIGNGSCNTYTSTTIEFTTDATTTTCLLTFKCDDDDKNSATAFDITLSNFKLSSEHLPASFAECTSFLGNSIRRGADNIPQALRYKFKVDDHIFDVYKNSGYELLEYGALVTKDGNLNEDEFILNEELSVNGVAIFKGKAYEKSSGNAVSFGTVKNGIIISFALYNIGVTSNGTNYLDYNVNFELRPYAIYEDVDGNEVVFYDDIVETSVFDVTDAILSNDTAIDYQNKYGGESNDYLEFLTDVAYIRELFLNKAVVTAYETTNRVGYVISDEAVCTISPSNLGNDVVIHSEIQSNYLADDYNSISNYADGTSELSKPNGVALNWNTVSNGTGQLIGYLVTISENSDLSNGFTYSSLVTSKNVTNLKIGTEYYWNVTAIYTNGIYTSETAKFSTSGSSPRNVDIGGVTNARDLGGLMIDGKRTNQGLIFRTGHLNNTTEEGICTIFDDLGIKTEIDLRQKSEAQNTFGEKINYAPCYMVYSGSTTISNNVESIKAFFEVLGDENNYPIIFHCAIGTDRTGMMAFFLNGLLGASEEQLYRDFLFSNFGAIGSSRTDSAISTYLDIVKTAEGNTLSEQIYNYLLSIGVSASDMDTFIKMMK